MFFVTVINRHQSTLQNWVFWCHIDRGGEEGIGVSTLILDCQMKNTSRSVLACVNSLLWNEDVVHLLWNNSYIISFSGQILDQPLRLAKVSRCGVILNLMLHMIIGLQQELFDVITLCITLRQKGPIQLVTPNQTPSFSQSIQLTYFNMNTYCTVLNIGKRNSLFEGDKISTVDDAHFKDDLSV